MGDQAMLVSSFFQELYSYISQVILAGLAVGYLQFSKTTDKPNENEIIINVPVALGMMSASFLGL